MSTDPPIVISGGSVTIEFDETQIPPDGKNKFRNANKKIKRVEITGDYNPATGQVQNGNVVVRIYYNNP
jgi:hypothetical protein